MINGAGNVRGWLVVATGTRLVRVVRDTDNGDVVKKSKFILYSPHLFVPMTASKVLTLEKKQNSFGFLLV